jgi:hypothetical protein
MRFQINQGWAIGQTLIPASTIIDIADKPDHELTEFERLAKGRIPPLDATALDYDSALVLWRSCPDHHRHRLRRCLSEFDTAMFEKLLGNEAVLARYWKG